MVVWISSSSTTRNVTFFAARKKALRPVRGLSLAGQNDDLRRPEGMGLLRKIPFKPSETWYGRSSLLNAKGETSREDGRLHLAPVGEAVAGEKRCVTS